MPPFVQGHRAWNKGRVFRRSKAEIADAFWQKVDRRGKAECWRWKGGYFSNGYGAFCVYRGNVRAHRYAYRLLRGSVPLLLDHRCDHKWCVNPWHLRASTQRANVLRGNGLTAVNARKRRCVHGHQFTKANTYRYRKGRRWHRTCLACVMNRQRKYRRRGA